MSEEEASGGPLSKAIHTATFLRDTFSSWEQSPEVSHDQLNSVRSAVQELAHFIEAVAHNSSPDEETSEQYTHQYDTPSYQTGENPALSEVSSASKHASDEALPHVQDPSAHEVYPHGALGEHVENMDGEVGVVDASGSDLGSATMSPEHETVGFLVNALSGSDPTETREEKPRVPKRKKASPPLKCAKCGSTETPEWRRGPDGQKSMCNACGLQWAKQRKKELATPFESTTSRAKIDMLVDAPARARHSQPALMPSHQQQQQQHQQQHPHHPQPQPQPPYYVPGRTAGPPVVYMDPTRRLSQPPPPPQSLLLPPHPLSSMRAPDMLPSPSAAGAAGPPFYGGAPARATMPVQYVPPDSTAAAYQQVYGDPRAGHDHRMPRR